MDLSPDHCPDHTDESGPESPSSEQQLFNESAIEWGVRTIYCNSRHFAKQALSPYAMALKTKSHMHAYARR